MREGERDKGRELREKVMKMVKQIENSEVGKMKYIKAIASTKCPHYF